MTIGVTPRWSTRRRARLASVTAAKIGMGGRNADSTRAVRPWRVTATIAFASATRASVTAASHSARLCASLITCSPATIARRGDALGVANDRVERPHGAPRVDADGGLARQHDGVDQVVDGVGRVAHLGARRARLGAHRLEHLRRDDHGNPARERALA